MITQIACPQDTPRLPQEIIDIIISHCHSDKRTLSVLALVSWSWTHSARRHLFTRVELRELYDFRSSEETAEELRPFDPFWRFHSGLELITRSPAIASCIRSLQIRANSNRDLFLVTEGFQFLSLLPNLRTLSLVGIYWPGLKPENVPTIMRGISTVASTLEELSLTTVTFVNTDDLALFVRAFPKVKRVSFFLCEWEKKWPGPATPVFRGLPSEPPLICLEYVGIDTCPPQAILEILLQRAAFKLDYLKGLKIYWDAEEFPMYEKLFRIIGRSLQSIELQLDSHQPNTIIPLLPECPQLSSFTINTCYRGYVLALVWFQPLLEAVAIMDTLEEFTIQCNLFTTCERNRYIPWERLDATLSRVPRFRQLNVVILRVDKVTMEEISVARREAVYSDLREMMPRLVQADMLRIREPEVNSILSY